MTTKPYKHALGTIELLDTTNYATWKRQCGRVLKGIKAWKIVVGEEQQPNNPGGFSPAAVAERAVYNDYITHLEQASAIICGSCCNQVQIYVEEIDNQAQMWTVIAARMDAAGTVVGRMTHLRKFHALRPIAGQPINSYFSRLLDVKNQLVGTPEAISEAEFKNHIFTSLPSMFDVIVINLQSRADATIQEVLDALKEHEQNHAMTVKPDSVSKALYTEKGGRSGNQQGRGGRGDHHGRGNYQGKECPQKWCDCCKTGTHRTANCWYKEKNNKRAQEQGLNGCYYCGEEGHMQNDCPARRKGNALRNSRTAQDQGGNGRVQDPPVNQQ
jgi:hypothetical protein